MIFIEEAQAKSTYLVYR